jgi:hypothetical protein
MIKRSLVTAVVVAVTLVSPASLSLARGAQQKPAKAPQAAPRGSGNPNGRQGAPAAKEPPKAEQILMKLNSMTPEEREKALSVLPPAQRERIEQRIQNFQKLPPAQQEKNLERLQRLNALPPGRQKEVRQSMAQLNKLPQDRKASVNRELRNMTGMTADERAAYMNTDAFRNRYSPDEQRVVGDLAEILPPHE